LPDFILTEDTRAQQIWDWSTDEITRTRSLLGAVRDRHVLEEEQRLLGQQLRLLSGQGQLTALGRHLLYHLIEYGRQERPVEFLLPGFLSSLTPASRVLDVGCGAGQTLLLLQPYAPQLRVGVDIDATALAFGTRLLQADPQDMQLVRCSACQMPFPDRSFTHILCRVALNYTHQQRALAEMVRLLKPGGLLYCHAEGPGYTLRRLLRASSPRALAGIVRDGLLGLLLEGTGWQPTPGGRWRGSSIFATARRLTRSLRQWDCVILHAEPTGSYLGLPFGYKLLAQRR
jgi:SAM-dependent methyltransferase